MKLKKYTAKTKDSKGCEFEYTVYKTIDRIMVEPYGKYGRIFKNKVIESVYIANGLNLEAGTIKELKERVSKI